MSDHEKITERLVAVHAALVDRLGAQPCIDPALTISQSGSCLIRLYPPTRYDAIYIARGLTPNEALDAADFFIAAMPSPEISARQEWQNDLGKVIDKGHDLQLPDEIMQPLRTSSQAMTENLLAAPEVGQ